MAEIKVRNNKYIFADDEFQVTSEDYESPEECYALSHDTVDALTRIGKGGKVRHHVAPTTLADDAYIDLPADSAGYGFILDTDGGEWAKFFWASDNTVTLMDNSTNVDDADTDGDIAIFDNTSSVRIRNRLGSEIEFLIDYHYTETPLAPTFRAFSVPSGVDNLDPELTINSISVFPTFRYKLGDADSVGLVPWGYGTTATASGSGGSYNQGSPGLGTNDDSVNCEGTRYYDAGNVHDVTTEDLVFEAVVDVDISSNQQFFDKRDGADEGYLLQVLSTGSITVKIEDTSANLATISSAALSNSWVHIMVFLDRSASGQIYVNGVASGSAVNISAVGTLTNSATFRLGATSAAGNILDSRIAYAAMWASEDWLDTHLQATVAAERFAKLCGYYPQIANGTYMPTTATRAFSAYVDKVENGYRKLYYVGSEWLRMCHRQDSLGEDVRGYLSETEAENLITESEDFLTTWTLRDAGDVVINDVVVCPDGRTKAASIAADSTDGQHGLKIDVALTAATYAYSIWVKSGSDATYGKNWCLLYNTEISQYCYFDVLNGTVGTSSLSCEGYIEGPFYSGDSTPIYRCCIVFTGTAATHSLRIYPAESDGDSTIVGDASTPSIYVWGAQCELGDYMTSPIRTSGSSLTRTADQLHFVAGDNIGGEDVGRGTIVFDGLFPIFDVGDSRYAYWIGDGGASGDRVFGVIETTNDDFQIGTRASGGSNGDAATGVSAYDDTKHTFRHTYETDDTRVYMDGVLKASDTSADMPDDVDFMFIGMNPSALKQPLGLLQNLKIYAEPTLKG